MSVVLSEHLPLLATAPDGIQKLRGLILELAVRGKLVPQDPSDEPASELLKRIAQERTQLEVKGVCKKTKPLPPIGKNEQPFALPVGWKWVHLGELSEAITSGSRDWARHYSTDGAIFVRMGNLSRGSYQLRLNNIQHVKAPSDGEGTRTRLQPGDLLLSITGEVGLLGLIPDGFGEAYINQHTCMIRIFSIMRERFIPEVLRSPLALVQYNEPQRGIKNSFRLSDVAQLMVPLPPLPEQHRIVAKVDELMAVCDRLEAEQADAESAHVKLVDTLLGTLTQSADTADLAANWQRLAEHFDTLFTTESSLDALKQTILQLAVMGKLVPQDLNDEPASALLRRMSGSRKIKRKICAIDMDSLEAPLPSIPENWQWTVIDQVASDTDNSITDGPFGANLKTEHYISSPGFRVIRLQNIGDREFKAEHHAYIDSARFNRLEKHHVFPNDLVVAGLVEDRVRCCKLPPDIGNALVKADCYRFSVHECLSTDFALNYLSSPLASLFAASHHHGMTLTRIGLGNFRQLPFPLPPVAEQHRIVAKVDELMTLCDRLKADLAESRHRRERLASTLIESALNAA